MTVSPAPIITLRPAVEAEQALIVTMIREAEINPLGIDWRRFLVAEIDRQVVGIGQIKPHGDGSRELASIAVSPTYQGQGIARLIIEALLEREKGDLYLMCESSLVGFYDRFGFVEVTRRRELPRYFRRMSLMASVVMPVYSLITREKVRLAFMRRLAQA